MPRKTETPPASPLRRSTRISERVDTPVPPTSASPVPGKRGRRASSVSSEPPATTEAAAKITKSRRLSLSQDSDSQKQQPTLRTSVLRRSVSKSPETLKKESSSAVRSTRSSTRGRSVSPTSSIDSKTEEPASAVGRKRRLSITTKIMPMDKIEENKEAKTPIKKRSLRSNSISPETEPVASQKKTDVIVDEVIIEEDEIEKPDDVDKLKPPNDLDANINTPPLINVSPEGNKENLLSNATKTPKTLNVFSPFNQKTNLSSSLKSPLVPKVEIHKMDIIERKFETKERSFEKDDMIYFSPIENSKEATPKKENKSIQLVEEDGESSESELEESAKKAYTALLETPDVEEIRKDEEEKRSPTTGIPSTNVKRKISISPLKLEPQETKHEKMETKVKHSQAEKVEENNDTLVEKIDQFIKSVKEDTATPLEKSISEENIEKQNLNLLNGKETRISSTDTTKNEEVKGSENNLANPNEALKNFRMELEVFAENSSDEQKEKLKKSPRKSLSARNSLSINENEITSKSDETIKSPMKNDLKEKLMEIGENNENNSMAVLASVAEIHNTNSYAEQLHQEINKTPKNNLQESQYLKPEMKSPIKTNGINSSDEKLEQEFYIRVSPRKSTSKNDKSKEEEEIEYMEIDNEISSGEETCKTIETRKSLRKSLPKTTESKEILSESINLNNKDSSSKNLEKGTEVQTARKSLSNSSKQESEFLDVIVVEDKDSLLKKEVHKSPKNIFPTGTKSKEEAIETIEAEEMSFSIKKSPRKSFSKSKAEADKSTKIFADNLFEKQSEKKLDEISVKSSIESEELNSPFVLQLDNSESEENFTKSPRKSENNKKDIKLDEISPNTSKPKDSRSSLSKENDMKKVSAISTQDKKLNDLLDSYKKERAEKDIQTGSSNDENYSDEESDIIKNMLNSFIDDAAEEGEESIISTDSNEIIDEGESIGSTTENSDDGEEDEEYENDSFIADDDSDNELLEGEEYDLDNKTKSKEKKKKVKRSRIIQIHDSSDEDLDKMSMQPYLGLSPPSVIEDLGTNEEIEEMAEDMGSEEDDVKVIEPIPLITLENLDRSVVVTETPRKSITIDLEESVNINSLKEDDFTKNLLSPVVDILCKSFESANTSSKCKFSLHVSLEYDDINNKTENKKRPLAENSKTIESPPKRKKSNDNSSNEESWTTIEGSDENILKTEKCKVGSLSIVEIEDVTSQDREKVHASAEIIDKNSSKGKKRKQKKKKSNQLAATVTHEISSDEGIRFDKTINSNIVLNECQKQEMSEELTKSPKRIAVTVDESSRLSTQKSRKKRNRQSKTLISPRINFNSDDESSFEIIDPIPTASKTADIPVKQKSSKTNPSILENKKSKLNYLGKEFLHELEPSKVKQRPKRNKVDVAKSPDVKVVPSSDYKNIWICEKLLLEKQSSQQYSKSFSIKPLKSNIQTSFAGQTEKFNEVVNIKNKLIKESVKRISSNTLLKNKQKKKF